MAHYPKPFFKKSRKLWYVEIDRRQHNLGPEREVAFRLYHELMREPASKQVDARSLVAIIDAFLEWVQTNRALDTYEWYRYRLERFARTYPDLGTQSLKPYHVQQWVDSYPQLSRTSRRNYFRSIKRCLKWAMKQGYISSDPLDHLEVPGADRKEAIVSVEQYGQLLSLIRDPGLRDLVVTTWETGCRPQESLRVEARHVDLKHFRWVFPKSEAKGKRQPRVVYLAGPAAAITQKLVEQYPTGRLFRNSDGRAWTPNAVNSAFDRIRIRMLQTTSIDVAQLENAVEQMIGELKPKRMVQGVLVTKTARQLRQEARQRVLAKLANESIPRFSLYALRHSWATRALQSGLDGLTVAILMGHSDPSTLARVYQHLSLNPEHLLHQASKVQGRSEP